MNLGLKGTDKHQNQRDSRICEKFIGDVNYHSKISCSIDLALK